MLELVEESLSRDRLELGKLLGKFIPALGQLGYNVEHPLAIIGLTQDSALNERAWGPNRSSVVPSLDVKGGVEAMFAACLEGNKRVDRK
jgi:hypothetical protein